MRRTNVFLIAAAIVAAPAAAQDNMVMDNTAATNAATTANTDPAAVADPTANGLAGNPATAPMTTGEVMADTSYGEPARNDDDRFPWGVLGLLGLAGLLGRRRRDDRDGDRTER